MRPSTEAEVHLSHASGDRRLRVEPSASPRLRVLLVAECCNPEMISVPLEGYSHVAEIRKVVDGHVVTSWFNAEALTNAGWREGVDFSGIDTRRICRPAWSIGEALVGRGKGWTMQAALYVPIYYYFEHLVWKRFGGRIARGKFDLVHRVTPLSPTAPSLLASRCKRAGVPFVWGPINGGLQWPRQFDSLRRKENEWLSYFRAACQLLPYYRSTRRDASAILMGSRDVYRQVPRDLLDRCFYVPENAIDPGRFTRQRTHRAARPIKIVFLGRLVPYKGADMLIEAAAPLVKSGDVTVDVLGDGPMMGELRQRVSSLGCEVGIQLRGWIKHEQVQEWLAASDVFAFPSVREFGGAVALEAMAAGAVPIVLDYGGPAELVTGKTGFLIPIGTRDQIVQRLRAILSGLAKAPREIDRRSELAVHRARELFTWQRKARRTVEIYQWVLNPSGPRPDYPMPEPDPD